MGIEGSIFEKERSRRKIGKRAEMLNIRSRSYCRLLLHWRFELNREMKWQRLICDTC